MIFDINFKSNFSLCIQKSPLKIGIGELRSQRTKLNRRSLNFFLQRITPLKESGINERTFSACLAW